MPDSTSQPAGHRMAALPSALPVAAAAAAALLVSSSALAAQSDPDDEVAFHL